jgi:hypothetical protein
MATPEELCACCDEYVALLSKRDAEGIAALLACSIPEARPPRAW